MIRKINKTGVLETLAGALTATSSTNSFNGDGKARETLFNAPQGLVYLPNGDLVIVDSNNNLIRKLVNKTGMIVTIGGTSIPTFNGDVDLSVTAFNTPFGIARNSKGELIIVDSNNYRIRMFTRYCEGNSTIDTTFTECQCAIGWTGDSCSITTCNGTLSTNSTVCSGNGQCQFLDYCQCFKGFEGNFCERTLQTTAVPTDVGTIVATVVVPISVVLIGSILAIIILILLLCCYKKQKSRKPESETNKFKKRNQTANPFKLK